MIRVSREREKRKGWKRMDGEIKTTKEMDFGNYGYKSYHIDEKDEDGFHFQRHVWTEDSGEVETENWIMTGRTK